MVKLTVMYNLPPDADHEEFIRWRTTQHQAENMAIPGIIKSDFYVVKEAWQREGLPYQYMTEAYFPDMETFRNSFFDREYQAKLAESLKLIVDPLFLISEEVLSESGVG
ncbi:MAG: EthD domain-containing protein [Anaerolineales bacterium]|nr:MAG: EthD domain-containing protein [Anaerolineales bacterium]